MQGVVPVVPVQVQVQVVAHPQVVPEAAGAAGERRPTPEARPAACLDRPAIPRLAPPVPEPQAVPDTPLPAQQGPAREAPPDTHPQVRQVPELPVVAQATRPRGHRVPDLRAAAQDIRRVAEQALRPGLVAVVREAAVQAVAQPRPVVQEAAVQAVAQPRPVVQEAAVQAVAQPRPAVQEAAVQAVAVLAAAAQVAQARQAVHLAAAEEQVVLAVLAVQAAAVELAAVLAAAVELVAAQAEALQRPLAVRRERAVQVHPQVVLVEPAARELPRVELAEPEPEAVAQAPHRPAGPPPAVPPRQRLVEHLPVARLQEERPGAAARLQPVVQVRVERAQAEQPVLPGRPVAQALPTAPASSARPVVQVVQVQMAQAHPGSAVRALAPRHPRARPGLPVRAEVEHRAEARARANRAWPSKLLPRRRRARVAAGAVGSPIPWPSPPFVRPSPRPAPDSAPSFRTPLGPRTRLRGPTRWWKQP